MSHFNVTIKITPPEGSKANEADVKYFMEGAITQYADHMKDSNHPLNKLDDDDIQVMHVEKVEA